MAHPILRAVISSILVVLSLGSLPRSATFALAATTSLPSHARVTSSRSGSEAGFDISVYQPDLLLTGGGSRASGKAAADSFYIYGGPAGPDAYGDAGEVPDGWIDGKFQNAELLPAVQPGTPYPSDGWFGRDLTENDPFWQLSAFNSPTGTQAIWSGQSVAQQPGWISGAGYGNSWDDWIDYRASVLDNTQPTTVNWSFTFNHDTEPLYDFFHAQWDSAGSFMSDLLVLDGSNKDSLGIFAGNEVTANLSVTLQPGDYAGNGNDEVHLRFRFSSDAGWSDEDGLWPTDGAVQIDDVTVDLGAQGGSQFDDFNSGFGNWIPTPAQLVGDFAKVFPRIGDIDPCAENETPQVGFIDDGTPPANALLQSTGGMISAANGYGVPGGFIVNFTGGLSGGRDLINNRVRSPAIRYDLDGPADDDADGALLLAFDRWTHLPLENNMFYVWEIRSTTDTPEPGENPTFDLTNWTGWTSNNFVYFSGTPVHGRTVINVANQIPDLSAVTYVQISLGVFQQEFFFDPLDGTPSPTFDNVSLQKAASAAPRLTARAIDLFQDSFSNTGTVATFYDGAGPNDETEFAIRLDRATAINGAGTTVLAGDSISVTALPVVPGTSLTTLPRLHYALFANPAFDGVRATGAYGSNIGSIPGPGGAGTWQVYTGTIDGDSTRTTSGSTIADRFVFDVGFDGPFDRASALLDDPTEPAGFFPGDWFFYYFEVSDTAGNTSTLPAGPGAGSEPFNYPIQGGALNVTNYGDMALEAYNRNFRVRGLPTIDDQGNSPDVLFVNDAFGFGNQPEWNSAWSQNGWLEGVDYDDFTVMGPSSGVDNGIGSSGAHGASAGQLAPYECLLYDSGPLSSTLLSDGSGSTSSVDRSNDQAVLADWHALPGPRRGAFWGDFLYSYLLGSGNGVAFAQNVLAVELGPGNDDVRPNIGFQSSPVVAPTGAGSSNNLFDESVVAFGGCPAFNRFDDLRPLAGSGAVRAHEFLSPSGNSGAYPAAASVWYDRMEGGSRKIDLSFPFGFQYVTNVPSAPGSFDGRSARSVFLAEVLSAFGHTLFFLPGTDAPGAHGKVQLTQNSPNPFNPKTTITLFAPRREHARLIVYDLRGRQVRALLDGPIEAGELSIDFDGRDDDGRTLASGVYLYKLEGFDEVLTRKMMLVK